MPGAEPSLGMSLWGKKFYALYCRDFEFGVQISKFESFFFFLGAH